MKRVRTLWVERGFSLQHKARATQTRLSGEGPRNRKENKQSRQPSLLLPHSHYSLLELLDPWKRNPVASVCSVPRKDTCSRSIYSAPAEQGMQQLR